MGEILFIFRRRSQIASAFAASFPLRFSLLPLDPRPLLPLDTIFPFRRGEFSHRYFPLTDSSFLWSGHLLPSISLSMRTAGHFPNPTINRTGCHYSQHSRKLFPPATKTRNFPPQSNFFLFYLEVSYSFFGGKKNFSTFNTHFFASFSCLRNSKRALPHTPQPQKKETPFFLSSCLPSQARGHFFDLREKKIFLHHHRKKLPLFTVFPRTGIRSNPRACVLLVATREPGPGGCPELFFTPGRKPNGKTGKISPL